MKEQERKYAIVIKKERVEVTEEVYKNYYRLMERERYLDKLDQCMKMLPEQERMLIHTLFFQGKSERQLSSESGIPLMTLNDRKRRILQKLKKFLEK